MSRKFELSAAQRRARDETGENIIVSAAAGSGKTAVLSKRVCRYICGGGDMDKLLIVTFAKAAAAEMRSRIAKELEQAHSQAPSKKLKKQVLKVYSAQICTIDSYMGKLVKEHFEKLNISPAYTMLDAVQTDVLENDILAEILEEHYKNMSPDFAQLADLLGGDGENETLNACILKTYAFLNSIPFPQKWMEYTLKTFDEPKIWIHNACTETKVVLKDFLQIFSDISASELMQKTEFAELYNLVQTMDAACRQERWDDLCGAAQAAASLPTIRITKGSELPKMQYRAAWKLFKDFFSKEIYYFSEKDIVQQLESLKQPVRALFEIVTEIFNRAQEQMRRINAYSFSAVAQMATALLIRDYCYEDGSYALTDTAIQLKQTYDEIMIDECQDVNDLQSLFFEAISKNNLFIVGDSKQCIYAFRGSNPDNFSKRRQEFHNITLNTNYRSREGVLNFVNFLFERLMTTNVGGTDYDEKEKLYYSGIYPEISRPDVQIRIVQAQDIRKKTETSALQLSDTASKIKQLLQTEQITEKDGTLRPVRLSDIAILVRNNKEAEDAERALSAANIPAFAKSSGSFLTTIDAATVLTFLRVLDNPYDDIALFKTLTGRLFDIDENAIVNARLDFTEPRAALYRAICAYEGDAFREFLSAMQKFRILIQNMPLHAALWQIYSYNGYLDKITALPAGEIRRNNLLQLYDFVLRYEQLSSNSLHRFLKFTARAARSAKEIDGAAPRGEFVKIMTMHASKGLEFPICFLPCLDKNLRQGKDEVKDLNIDVKLGIGLIIKDQEGAYKYASFMHNLIHMREQRRETSENLRLFYVAMTRAREKLILTAAVSQKTLQTDAFENDFAKARRIKRGDGTFYAKPITAAVLNASSFLDYIAISFSHHPNAGAFASCFGADYDPVCDVCVTVVQETEEHVTQIETPQLSLPQAELQRRFDFRYPTMNNIPAKISVTELIKGYISDEDCVQLIPAEDQRSIPEFLSGKTPSGAERGTAIHKFMAAADLSKPVKEQIALLTDDVLTKEQAEVIPVRQIEQYQKSALCAMMLSAKHIFREQAFVIKIPASLYDRNAPDKTAQIFLQGAIDVLCEFDDHVVIIDYKSDRGIDETEFVNRYTQQMYYYKTAAEKLFEKPVSDVYLWAFSLGHAIKLDIPQNPC